MSSLSPEQKLIAEMVHQVEAEVARGEVVLEGTGAMWKNAFVHVVSHRLGGISHEMNNAVYGVLRLLAQGNGQSQ